MRKQSTHGVFACLMTVLSLVALPVQAQPVDGDAAAPGDAPAPAAVPDAAIAPDALRRAHLDQLFARLAAPDNPDWEQVQGQIWAAWEQSGSAAMDFLHSRAERAMEVQKFDEALEHLNDLVRLAPEFAEGWNKRATLHFLREDYGQSISDIAEVLSLEPRHFGALSGLGIMLDRIGDKAGALEAYRRAAEVHPNLPGARDGIEKLSKDVEGRKL